MAVKTLRASLTWRLLLAAAVPLLVVGLSSLEYVARRAQETAEAKNLLLARSAASEVRSVLREPVAILQQIRAHLESGTDETPAAAHRLLGRSVRASDFFDSVYRVDGLGRVTGVGLRPELQGREADFVGADVSHQPYFEAGRRASGATWSEPYLSLVTARRSLTVTMPMGAGLLVGNLGLDGLRNLVERTRAADLVQTWIVDRSGTVIFHPDRNLAEQRHSARHLPPVRAGLDGWEGTLRYWEGEEQFLGSVAPIPETGWLVLVSQSAAAADATARRVQGIFLGGLAGAVVLSLLAAAAAARRISRPVGQLVASARAIARGEYGGPVPPQDHEELEDLAEAFRGASRAIQERERALHGAHERLRALVQASPLAIVAIDTEERITLWNPAAEELLGWTESEVLGRPPPYIPPEGHAEYQRIVARSLGGTPVRGLEVRRVRRDGRPVDLQVFSGPLHDPGGGVVGVMAVLLDLTDRKRQELERRQLEAKVQQAQKLESLGVLAGGIAHDFNNLLMGILGHADLALLKLPPEAPARPHLKAIETASQRAAELTNQMLAYSGKGRFVVERIRLSRVVEEMAHLLETVVSKKARLRYHFAPDVPPIEADPSQLRQVVMNLITNASDALGDQDGVISVSTGTIRADRAYLAATYLEEDLPEGTYAYVEVSDTGCGMDRETLARLFDPFFTTKFAGRGLGLAAVLGIVRAHRGALRIESEPGRGTTFRVLFPCAGEPSDLREEAPPETALGGDPQFDGTALVVDDDPAVRGVSQLMLEQLGFRVVTAADGREGVEAFRARAGEIRLVILDLTMPILGGDEAAQAIRALCPDVPILLSSGYSEQDATRRFPGAAFSGFLQKPYRSAALLAKVREVLGRGAPVPPR